MSSSCSQRGARLFVKRCLDVGIAAALLVLCAGVLAVAAVAVKLDSRGPVLYRSRRVGQGGREFDMLKFRSMRADADEGPHRELIRSLLSDGGAAAIPADGMYKLVNDDRVTRVGRILRATSLDELPQLINVLRGEMSIVGPRPDVPYAVAGYDSWQRRRFDVLPGMTGLWQVSGRGELHPREMLRLDVEYVERWSLRLDLAILMRSVPAVLNRTGSA